MDIAPIYAIRPVTMIKPSLSAPDLSHVFEVEYLGHSADDEYTPAHRKAARGLEDDDEDVAADEGVEADAPHRLWASGSVSFFA